MDPYLSALFSLWNGDEPGQMENRPEASFDIRSNVKEWSFIPLLQWIGSPRVNTAGPTEAEGGIIGKRIKINKQNRPDNDNVPIKAVKGAWGAAGLQLL